MLIRTDPVSDPDAMRFVPGEAVLPSGKADFPDPESSRRSPLARRLFEIDGVAGVTLARIFHEAGESLDFGSGEVSLAWRGRFFRRLAVMGFSRRRFLAFWGQRA